MDLTAFEALLTPAGQELLAEASQQDVSESGLLHATDRLRSRYPAELVSAALTQVRLRIRAVDKFGLDGARMYFTPAGLEQSTRASVAAHRARRFADLHGPVLELCCGIAADLLARARTRSAPPAHPTSPANLGGDAGPQASSAGEGVGRADLGIELDAVTAAVARANVQAFGLGDVATVRQGDAALQDPSGFAGVFADPGRRSGRGRIFDPRAYEPPLEVLIELARRAPAGCVKVAPGIPYEAIPAGAEAEWISDGGEVKEAALWLGGLTSGVARRATMLPSGATLTPERGLGAPEVGPWRRYLYEPDGAVIRAHLVAEVARLLDGVLADPNIAYITGDRLHFTPFAKGYEIEDVLPFSLKRLRSELRRRDVGTLTIKKRGSAVDVERLRRELRPTGSERMTVVLTRVGEAPFALLCHPVDQ